MKFSLTSAVPVLLGMLSCGSHAYAAQSTPPKPRITAAQAETVAARHIHGKALSAKYEFEDGRWQYAVVVDRQGQLFEAEVNSTTAKVLAVEKTSRAEETAEAKQDKATHK